MFIFLCEKLVRYYVNLNSDIVFLYFPSSNLVLQNYFSIFDCPSSYYKRAHNLHFSLKNVKINKEQLYFPSAYPSFFVHCIWPPLPSGGSKISVKGESLMYNTAPGSPYILLHHGDGIYTVYKSSSLYIVSSTTL
jgi:hypothetical protein